MNKPKISWNQSEEEAMDTSNHADEFNSTTNWNLAVGSLIDSISFESSFTANPESDDGTAVNHVAKSPLLLLPPVPVPNGEPCEITITFAQEHELRQVYIRSSARVYEVYYTKKRRHGSKEYLCTVRCGVAVRDEQVLQIPLTDSHDSNKSSMDRKGRTSEDDWVEVKAGDDSLLNDAKGLLPMLQLGKQDFYEATAEINDAEPCTSITLRLLSLQDKRCALVDQVYVFADPSESEEQEEASGAGNSSSSSLMAMFMPAILQLSRGKERDTQVSSDKSNSTNPLGYSNDSDQIVNEIHQEINFSKGDQMGVSPPPVLVDTLSNRVSGEEIRPAISCTNMETILYDLVNKVSRIETILTRFEDQMLKPINSIDARLQLVEKKLQQLGKKPFDSELLCQTRIPNPDALGHDTDKIPDTDELDRFTHNPRLVSCTKLVVPVEDGAVVLPKNRLEELEFENISNSNSGNEMISTEPEISNEEVGHSFEEKPKRSLSINDALASALAGLLSSHSITDGKYSKALLVTPPEFLNDDDEVEIEEKPQTSGRPDKNQVAAQELENTHSTLGSPTSSQEEPEITPCIKDDGSQEMIFGGDEEEAETVVSIRDNALDEEMFTSSTKADSYTEKENHRDSDSLIHELKNPNVTTAKCKGEPGMDDVLKSVFGLQPTTSSVDFLTPVLDVRFSSESQESDSKSFFEALFTEDSKTDVDCKNEAYDDNLVSVEDEELKGPPTDTLSSVEMDHYETNEMHLHLNGEISEASLI